ncbi:hypothetical protein V2G26_001058 [Clonostachys chloroleuca]
MKENQVLPNPDVPECPGSLRIHASPAICPVSCQGCAPRATETQTQHLLLQQLWKTLCILPSSPSSILRIFDPIGPSENATDQQNPHNAAMDVLYRSGLLVYANLRRYPTHTVTCTIH